jgi:hypothetical protein
MTWIGRILQEALPRNQTLISLRDEIKHLKSLPQTPKIVWALSDRWNKYQAIIGNRGDWGVTPAKELVATSDGNRVHIMDTKNKPDLFGANALGRKDYVSKNLDYANKKLIPQILTADVGTEEKQKEWLAKNSKAKKIALGKSASHDMDQQASMVDQARNIARSQGVQINEMLRKLIREGFKFNVYNI